jgi:hypothetical protein
MLSDRSVPAPLMSWLLGLGRARVARLLRSLATRLDGPPQIVVHLPRAMTRDEIAAIASAATHYNGRWAN